MFYYLGSGKSVIVPFPENIKNLTYLVLFNFVSTLGRKERENGVLYICVGPEYIFSSSKEHPNLFLFYDQFVKVY